MSQSNKVSLICTVKNEEDTIEILLESICNQTKMPDDIVIVDGGSSDTTIEIIKRYSSKLPIKLISSLGVNIAEGRNIAIENATYNIIASTDGGCKLEPKWFSNLIKPFEELDVDVVCGVYRPWYESEFEEIVSFLTFPKIEKLESEKYLPSSRSVAFRKSSWKLVGGYPTRLDKAEDTVFDLRLRESGMKFVLARNAIVYWKVRKDIKKIFRQYYDYAVGEGLAGIFLKNYLYRYITIIVIAALVASRLHHEVIFWFLLVFFVLVGFCAKYLRKVENPSIKRLLYALLIASIIETSLSIGYLKGIFSRFKRFYLRSIK